MKDGSIQGILFCFCRTTQYPIKKSLHKLSVIAKLTRTCADLKYWGGFKWCKVLGFRDSGSSLGKYLGAIQIIRDILGRRGGWQKCHVAICIGNFTGKG